MTKPTRASFRDRVHRWWHGEDIQHEPARNNALSFYELRTRRHWTARLVRWFWDYWRAYHQWIIGTIVAIVVVLVMLAR
jgi:hypothetical protein